MRIYDYECVTTFWQDFSIAEAFGIDAIKDTYKRVFEEWKNNYVYLTELVLILNHKIWQYYEKKNNKYSYLYEELYIKTEEYAAENLKDGELKYFWRVLD